MNVLSNAIDALEESLADNQGQIITPTITFTLNKLMLIKSKFGLQIMVLSIPESVQHRLFNPFFTTNLWVKEQVWVCRLATKLSLKNMVAHSLASQNQVREQVFIIRIPVSQFCSKDVAVSV